MTITALTCPACGAPLSPSKSEVVTCSYCHHTLAGVAGASWEATLQATELDDAADTRPWCRVDFKKFLVRGLLARGERCDVFLGERDLTPTEIVVIKALRGEADRDAFDTEARFLRALGVPEGPESPFFSTLMPQVVAHGRMTKRNGARRAAIVYRWRSGFLYTLRDVRAAYPDGVDPRAMVWMWRRVLDTLAFLRRRGVRHGAVLPEHVLVHPRDHAAALVGWSRVGPAPPGDLGRSDVVESARAMLFTAACDASDAGRRLPAPLAAVVTRALAGEAGDARALSAEVLDAATAAFGPPTFHPFTMPGWG